jgi:hypothetical protein
MIKNPEFRSQESEGGRRSLEVVREPRGKVTKALNKKCFP